MYIYILTRTRTCGCDEAWGFVVTAPSPQAARALASAEHGDEGAACWLTLAQSSCLRLGVAGKGWETGIQLKDYRAG